MNILNSEVIKLRRDVEAIAVPAGTPSMLLAEQDCQITQALGGSYTLYADGNLYRLDGEDADAIGETPPAPISLPENPAKEDVERLVWEQLKTVYDPEIPFNIVDLGLVYECDVKMVNDNVHHAHVQMTLTAPGCGMGDVLVTDVRIKLEKIPTLSEAQVELVFDPPWNQYMMSEEARLQTGMF